jgi:hypothetical protein
MSFDKVSPGTIREEKFTQSLASLWFDTQMTQRYLSDKTFGSAQPRSNSANLNTPIRAGTFRRPSVTQVPLVVSAKQQWLI